jgi:amidase
VGCLFAIVALITPRFVLFILWLFTDYLNTAISSGWLGLLGFFFLPTTTIAYAVAQNEYTAPGGGLETFGVVLIAVGVAVDVGLLGGSGRGVARRATRAPAIGSASMDVPAFEHDEATIVGLGEQLAAGSLTARGLVEAYLARIEALDGALRSVLQVNPDALAIAEALDDERADGRVRGPLHGIPVLVKDNIDTADRMNTTAGSFALGEVTPARDAFVVARLRGAGAVILGKANLSEWANFRSTRSSSGWSARGGQGRNPYALDRNPCGSSSGSGVAVSASLCAVAVGTETDGSILCPSSINGIVGIKPTVGLVSRSGVVPISHTQDTPGPIARTVADAAALLTALAGHDPRDAATADAPPERDFAASVDRDGLRGARIGVARNLAGFHDRTDRAFEQALAAMGDAGAELVDPVEVPHATELEDPSTGAAVRVQGDIAPTSPRSDQTSRIGRWPT